MVFNGPQAITFDLWQTLIFESDGSGRSSKRKELRISCIAGFLSAHNERVDEELIGYQLQRLSDEIIAGQDLGLARYAEFHTSGAACTVTAGSERRTRC